MDKMITNMRSFPPLTTPKNTAHKLSNNAQKYLFPMKDKMILVKRPGYDGKFAMARVNIKLQDFQTFVNTAKDHSKSKVEETKEIEEG